MNRIEKKIANKKKNKRLTLIIFIIILFMLTGLFMVDSTIRDVLALENSKIAGYENKANYIMIYILGESFAIEKEKIHGFLKTTRGFFEEKRDKLIKQINEIISKF